MREADLLAERGKTHGDFGEVAAVAQSFREEMRQAPGWAEMHFCQREALDMIASKVARIVCGDPGHPDHWDDIAGYARLGGGIWPE